MIVLRVGQVMDLITYGESNRMVSATAMNSESSRSHSVFCIELHQKLRDGFVKVKCMLLSPCLLLSHHFLLVCCVSLPAALLTTLCQLTSEKFIKFIIRVEASHNCQLSSVCMAVQSFTSPHNCQLTSVCLCAELFQVIHG